MWFFLLLLANSNPDQVRGKMFTFHLPLQRLIPSQRQTHTHTHTHTESNLLAWALNIPYVSHILRYPVLPIELWMSAYTLQLSLCLPQSRYASLVAGLSLSKSAPSCFKTRHEFWPLWYYRIELPALQALKGSQLLNPHFFPPLFHVGIHYRKAAFNLAFCQGPCIIVAGFTLAQRHYNKNTLTWITMKFILPMQWFSYFGVH